MGDTTNIYVVAEVEENDVAAVHVGQRATITSEAVNEPLQGTVEEIGRLIYKNDIFNLDPRADRDTRIVEARIKLDTPQPVAGLTYLEVSVRIDTKAQPAAANHAGR
jgi:HlyD family secretion protein